MTTTTSFTHQYVQLTGANQAVEGKVWTTERLLSEYVQCTDGLVGKLDGTIPLQGTDVYVPGPAGRLRAVPRDLQPPDSVLYLDKSARPVRWLVAALWPILARTPGTLAADHVVPTKPIEHFLNLDKGDWLRRMQVPEAYLEDAPEHLVDITKIDPDHIARIRGLYCTPPVTEDELDEVWNRPTVLDGRHVMIVDEVKSSGKTLSIAQMLLAAAIPDAVFSGAYWSVPAKIPLNKGVPVRGKLQFKVEWVPMWYTATTSLGRGVGNRDPQWPDRMEKEGRPVSRVQRVGRHVLSTPPHDPSTAARTRDAKADALRQDIARLARDLAAQRVLYRPSAERSPRDFKERVQAIAGLDFETWKQRRDEVMRGTAESR